MNCSILIEDTEQNIQEFQKANCNKPPVPVAYFTEPINVWDILGSCSFHITPNNQISCDIKFIEAESGRLAFTLIEHGCTVKAVFHYKASSNQIVDLVFLDFFDRTAE